MSELSPASRELLAAAREQLGPDPAAVARMRQAISATVGGAAVGASTGSVAAVGSARTTSAATSAGGGALVTKLGLVSVLAVVAIGAAVWTVRGDDEPRASTAPELAVDRTGAPSSSPSSSSGSNPASAPAMTPTRVEAGAPSVEVDAPALSAPVVRPAKPARAHVSASAKADLAREVELIDQAMVALRQGQPRDALVAIRKHAVETRGHGQLAEDAAAIEIEASCRLHDPTVAAKLAAFDQRYPTSVQRSRLSSQCK